MRILLTLALLLIINSGGSLAAAEGATHLVYRVTSYNLGAIVGSEGDNPQGGSQNFSPLLITNSAADIFSSEYDETISLIVPSPHSAKTNNIAVSAEFDATDKISLQGAFGVTQNLWTPETLSPENASSWEANLGIIYKLLGNFSYELHFGYMDTGDIFANRSSYTNVDSIIMVSNKLTLSF